MSKNDRGRRVSTPTPRERHAPAADAVRVTLGPKGRNVVLDKKWGAPTITNDGVSIAKEIELEDPYERIGAELVKEVAKKTDDVAGDGTTTATVLAWAMVREGLRNVAAGANPMSLKKGIEAAVARAVEGIKDIAVEVETKEQVAQAGVDLRRRPEDRRHDLRRHRQGRQGRGHHRRGVADLRHGVELVEGMRLDKGDISPGLRHRPRAHGGVLDDPYILLYAGKISAVRDLLPVLEKVMQTAKPLIIIAEDVEGEALATLVVNKIRGTFKSVAVKAPASATAARPCCRTSPSCSGGQVISEDVGLKLDNVTLDMLGRDRVMTVTKDETTLVEGAGDEADIKGRVNQLRAELEITDSDYDAEKLQERLAKLSGGVAIIKVGAATEVELKEKKHRIEDAVSTTKAAVEEGVVPGGGVALLRAQARVNELIANMVETRPPAPASSPARWRSRSSRSRSTPAWRVAWSSSGSATSRAPTASTPPPATTRTCSRAGVIDAAKVTRSACRTRRADRRPLPHHRGRHRRQAHARPRGSQRRPRLHGRLRASPHQDTPTKGSATRPTPSSRPGPAPAIDRSAGIARWGVSLQNSVDSAL